MKLNQKTVTKYNFVNIWVWLMSTILNKNFGVSARLWKPSTYSCLNYNFIKIYNLSLSWCFWTFGTILVTITCCTYAWYHFVMRSGCQFVWIVHMYIIMQLYIASCDSVWSVISIQSMPQYPCDKCLFYLIISVCLAALAYWILCNQTQYAKYLLRERNFSHAIQVSSAKLFTFLFLDKFQEIWKHGPMNYNFPPWGSFLFPLLEVHSYLQWVILQW